MNALQGRKTRKVKSHNNPFEGHKVEIFKNIMDLSTTW